MTIPQDLLQCYAEIVKNCQNTAQAAAHLQNFVLDVNAIEKYIADAIEAAQKRAQGQ